MSKSRLTLTTNYVTKLLTSSICTMYFHVVDDDLVSPSLSHYQLLLTLFKVYIHIHTYIFPLYLHRGDHSKLLYTTKAPNDNIHINCIHLALVHTTFRDLPNYLENRYSLPPDTLSKI